MRLCASISFMFREHSLLDRFSAARAAGFAGVEIQRLSEGDPDEMARAASDAGVQVVLVNVSAGDYLDGGNGLSCVPGREQRFHDALQHALEAAATLGAQHVHLGPSRIPADSTREECTRTYLANVATALDRSRTAGTSLLIEAMNRVESPTALLPDVESAAGILNTVNDVRLGLQFDIYHVAMNGEHPLDAFMRHRSWARHVQFSDVPGRHEPGTGTLDIPSILAGMQSLGYEGWYGAEYHPRSRTDESLRWMSALVA